ncbi:methyltransferase [Streptomonospora sediminis]
MAWTVDDFAEAVDGTAVVALRAAATLRIADHITRGTTGSAELARSVGAAPDELGRLMRFLACRGVFAETPGGGYELTPLSALLLDGHPSGLRELLDLDGMGARMDAAVRTLPELLRTGRGGYAQAHGTGFYGDAAAPGTADPGFNELREAHAVNLVPELVAACGWDGVGAVVDVGGGTGEFLLQLLRSRPAMRGCLVDLPAAADRARRRAEADDSVADRLSTAPGSFFDPLPQGADLYTLINVLHNWNDEDALRILTKCAAAAGSGPSTTEILVAEHTIDEENKRMTTAMDLRMLLLCGGRERTEAEFRDLGSRAGLELARDTGLSTGMRLLFFRPAE